MDEYGVPDLRQLMASRTQFCTTSQFQEPFSAHGNLTAQPNYQPMLVPAGGLVDHLHPPHYSTIINGCGAAHPPNNNAAATTSSAAALYGIDLEHGHGWNNNINVGMNAADGGNNMNYRWPRQETLTLLEIRSGLDSKFKETNQKGPLWDEVSRYIYIYRLIFYCLYTYQFCFLFFPSVFVNTKWSVFFFLSFSYMLFF